MVELNGNKKHRGIRNILIGVVLMCITVVGTLMISSIAQKQSRYSLCLELSRKKPTWELSDAEASFHSDDYAAYYFATGSIVYVYDKDLTVFFFSSTDHFAQYIGEKLTIMMVGEFDINGRHSYRSYTIDC